ncbi:hypothetical protein CLU79DRAFT_840157 [Phycomyces nitens]|nr:hypothetical protein CLU79DRAFT_840157 [Phycomyces nitens]
MNMESNPDPYDNDDYIFDKLDIRLTGIAYRYLIEFEENLTEPQDLNFDTHNYYNPENSDYGNEIERQQFHNDISDAIQKNEAIKPGTFCNVPASETIPVAL